GGDEARALVGAVVPDRLADPGGEECANDAEHRGQNEAARIVGSRRQHSRDDAGDEADDDDPDQTAHAHDVLPPTKPELISPRLTGGCSLRCRSAAGRPASGDRPPAAGTG